MRVSYNDRLSFEKNYNIILDCRVISEIFQQKKKSVKLSTT